ncbi:GNAT family N-acetyltransferase [Pseudalkalibacillus sp. Hm43]|uniref:GNAT family N-acetyltransferase n=1 Tax=Pseudalkalibacillus sp. Hm43 TaxID=3450742 RepID=UPI003F434CFF
MNQHHVFPDLETDRLRLRGINEEDTDFIYRHFSNEMVCKYLYDEEPIANKEEAQELVNSYHDSSAKGYNRWILVKKEDGNSIGTCGFHLWDRTNHIAEIGYDLGHEYWRQGYMKEALKQAIESGFRNMNLNRINAFTAIENEASIQLLKSLGFKNEGIYREKHLFRGQYYDHYSFSLLRREWEPHNMG